NPVLRQYLRQRYTIDLPELVDLTVPDAVDALHRLLVQQIQASAPGVTLEKIERPRIDLVLERARRRLDAYRRRVRLTGRAARSHLGLDYSYAPGKVHPLGVQLFTEMVTTPSLPERVLHEAPRPRVHANQPSDDTIERETFSV